MHMQPHIQNSWDKTSAVQQTRRHTNTCLQQAHNSAALVWEVPDTGHQAGGVKPGAPVAGQASKEEYQPERCCYQSAYAMQTVMLSLSRVMIARPALVLNISFISGMLLQDDSQKLAKLMQMQGA